MRLRKRGPWWHLVWTDERGRERSRTLRTRYAREARRLMREAEEAPRTRLSAPEAVDGFLATLRAAGRRDGTLDCYRRNLRHLVRDMGPAMHRWTRVAFDAALRKHPAWSPRTQQLYTTMARALRRWALDMGHEVPDFARGVRAPRGRPPEPEPIPEDCIPALLAHAADHDYLGPPVHLGLLAGLALADIRALRWEEVDLRSATIRRRREKTGQPLAIPIAPALRTVLEREPRTSPYVCYLPESSRRSLRELRSVYRAAKVPVPRQGADGFHRLRHTFATRLVASGADLPTVRRLMGHRPGSTVTLCYFHGSAEADREAMERAWGG